MRLFVAATLAASLFATNLLAAEAVSPLAPGQPAGVKKAQGDDGVPVWWVYGGVAVVAIIVVATTGGCSACTSPSAPSTSSTQ